MTEAQHLSGKTRDGREVSLEEHGDIMLKSYALSFAHGAEKIFYTSFRAPSFAPPEFRQAALVGANGEKRPAYHALETLVQKLGAFTAAEKLAPGRYRFLVDREEIYVLWGDGSLDLEKAGAVRMTDIYGEETSVNASTIRLGNSPVFLEGAFTIPAESAFTPSGPATAEQWQEEKLIIPGTYCDADVVQLDDGRRRMYYSLEPEAPDFEGQVYSAVSEDGKNWVQEEGVRLKWATFPSVIGLPEGQAPLTPSGEPARWRMYFQGSPADAAPGTEAGIVSAISTDGLDWVLEDGFRIMTAQQGEHDVESVAAATVARLADGTYLMVYRGSAGENRFGKTDPFNGQPVSIDYLVSAASTDGLNWTPGSIVVDSRNEEMRDQIDGPELVVDGEDIKLYCNSYEGVYALSIDHNGEALTSPRLVLRADGYHAPSDVTVVDFGESQRMYYGIHTEGIYTAVMTD